MRRWGAGAYLLFFLGPFAWQLLTSVWPEDELWLPWPTHLTWENYQQVWRSSFLWAIWNSFVLSSATTLVCLLLGTGASFALAKLPLRGKHVLLVSTLAISMFPPIATVSPLYLVLRALGLRDVLLGLVLPYTTFTLPLTLWLLTSFFRELPDELYRAARVDGCSPWGAFWRVLLPLAAPGLGTTALLVFIFAWNEFLFALTFLSTPDTYTVPVALSLFASGFREPWGQLAAASVLATVPLVVMTLAFQRRIVSGLTAGAVKE